MSANISHIIIISQGSSGEHYNIMEIRILTSMFDIMNIFFAVTIAEIFSTFGEIEAVKV